jgi:hypothetical protein
MMDCEKCATGRAAGEAINLFLAERHEVVPGFYMNLCAPCQRRLAWTLLTHDTSGDLRQNELELELANLQRASLALTEDEWIGRMEALLSQQQVALQSLYYAAQDWLDYGKPGGEPSFVAG